MLDTCVKIQDIILRFFIILFFTGLILCFTEKYIPKNTYLILVSHFKL